jgi:enoyl-CoA hydratase/carnithine racemase
MEGTSTEPLLLRAHAGGVARLTLNRPAARNSLSRAMLAALAMELEAIAADQAVRVVVLAAAGPAFCAGHDLREITAHRADADGGAGFYAGAMAACAAVMQAIVALPQPVIAEVQGVATAAGCQLVASCDLALAGSSARFCTPGVEIGLFCTTPAIALSRAVAAKPALEMLLTGAMIDAAEAHRLHLVNRVVPDAALTAEVTALAHGIAARSAVAVRLGKAAFHRTRALPLDAAYADAASVMACNLMAEDAAEGIGAFLAKRKPVWKDR